MRLSRETAQCVEVLHCCGKAFAHRHGEPVWLHRGRRQDVEVTVHQVPAVGEKGGVDIGDVFDTVSGEFVEVRRQEVAL